MKTILIFLGLLLFASRPSLGQEAFVLPSDIQSAVEDAMKYAGAAYVDPNSVHYIEAVHAAYAPFSAAMDQLGARADSRLAQQMFPLEDRDIRAKLITIAWYRRMHPELFAEIESQYLRRVHNPHAEFPHSPDLRLEHMEERYRLVWEYFMIAPPPPKASALYDLRAITALGQIHNTASVETLRYCFLPAAREDLHVGSDGTLNGRQSQLLGAMACFHNEQGLKALLDCGIQADRQQSRQPETTHWDVVTTIHNLMYPQLSTSPTAGWDDFLLRYSKARLSPEQRQFLTRVVY